MPNKLYIIPQIKKHTSMKRKAPFEIQMGLHEFLKLSRDEICHHIV